MKSPFQKPCLRRASPIPSNDIQREFLLNLLMLLSGIWMFGIGSRFVLMCIYFPNQSITYHTLTSDLLVDWLPLMLLGIAQLYLGLIPRLQKMMLGEGR